MGLVTLFWATIPGCLAGALFFARRWRRARVITPVEFLEGRFNSVVRQLFAWSGIPMKVLDDALKVFATGLFVSTSTGLNLQWSIAACGLVMVAYTFLGGLWALVVTDYVQFLMKTLAILLLLPLAIVAAGGVERAFTGLPPGFFAPSGGPYGATYIAGFVVLMMISYNASWSLAQKYYSVRDEREAAKTAYCAAALNLVGAPLMILPALIGRHLLPDLIAGQRTADTYMLLVITLLPAGMIGIIVAAMFSATMAVVSADFNAIASVLTKDVYQRLFRPDGIGRAAAAHRPLDDADPGADHDVPRAVDRGARSAGVVQHDGDAAGAVHGADVPAAAGGAGLAAAHGARRAGWVLLRPRDRIHDAGAEDVVAAAAADGASLSTVYTFEGVSLLANAGATVLGLVIGTVLGPRDEAEARRATEFFATARSADRPRRSPARHDERRDAGARAIDDRRGPAARRSRSPRRIHGRAPQRRGDRKRADRHRRNPPPPRPPCRNTSVDRSCRLAFVGIYSKSKRETTRKF